MTLEKISKYPLLAELGDHTNDKCDFLKCTCSTCLYCQEPDDGYLTGDYRSRCVYSTKAERGM